jgi:CheY-like chemotaxis protein
MPYELDGPASDRPSADGSCEILVVEDSPEVSEAIVTLLEQQGYRVNAVANGEEAIEILRKHKPRLVFVDLVMPVLSGLDLIDTMRMDKTLAQIPIVAMTASHLRPRGVKTLSKPFGITGLLGVAKLYCDDCHPK